MDSSSLSSIPITASFAEILFFLCVLSRLSGMFIASPFWSNANLSGITRSGLVLFITALMAVALYGDYHGPEARFTLPDIPEDKGFAVLLLIIVLAKEVAVGYLLGFCFSIIFEALRVAGQMVGVMIGLSISEILDPVSGMSQSIIAQIFTLTISLLLIVLDLHHPIIETVAGSFHILPIGYSELHQEMMNDVIHGTARLFPYGLRFAAIPYVILFLVTVALGFMARVMPEMNIFMVGFPLKIFIGYYALIAAMGFFPMLFQQSFTEYQNMANRVLYHMQPEEQES